MYPNHTLFTDANNYVYLGILTQAADGPDDLRPISNTSVSFSNSQQRWFATEKEAFAVYQTVLKFGLYLRGAQYLLHCNHKPLESFLLCCMKIPNLNHW